jgi:hypothetical protein
MERSELRTHMTEPEAQLYDATVALAQRMDAATAVDAVSVEKGLLRDMIACTQTNLEQCAEERAHS